MACLELSTELTAELLTMVQTAVIAAAGDKNLALELFTEDLERKGTGWAAKIIFGGIVRDVTLWSSGYKTEFTDSFATPHQRRTVE